MSRRPSLAFASTALAAMILAGPAAAQWVGGQRSAIRRAEQPPPMLGGLDLTGYCRQRGYYVARLEHSTWICVSENGRMDIDLDDACRAAFGPDARARRMSDSPMSWICFGEVDRRADMGEGAATAGPDNDAGIAPTTTAPAGPDGTVPPGTTSGTTPDSPPAPATQGTVAPPILGVPPLGGPPAASSPAAPEAGPAPTGPLALWTGLPFYARAVIAGLGALVLGLLLGALLRRKPGRED